MERENFIGNVDGEYKVQRDIYVIQWPSMERVQTTGWSYGCAYFLFLRLG